jgi:3-oxoacyl-[acyl-carrier protein] reductase
MLGELKEDVKNKMIAKIPLARFGKSEEVAKAVKFLVSEKAGYITGQTLVLDGGLSIS